MEEPQKANEEVLLGPRKLTWEQIIELPELEEQAYIRSLTAKELGGVFTRQMVKNLNYHATESVKKR